MGIFAVPPGLPLVLLLIGAAARSVLKKDGLLLLFPEIIKHGAAVDMVCFDKTGTLTDKSVSPPVAGMLCNETLGISSSKLQVLFEWSSKRCFSIFCT